MRPLTRSAFGANGRRRPGQKARPPAKPATMAAFGDSGSEDPRTQSPYPCSPIHQSMCSSSTTIGMAPLPITAA